MKSICLAEIAEKLGAQLHGDGQILISSMASILNAGAGQITFLASSQYRNVLQQVKGSAIILTAEDLPYCTVPALVVKDPYLSYAVVAQMLDNTPKPADNIANSAIIGKAVTLGNNVSIGHHAVIEDGVLLGDNVCIGAGCFIGKRAKIDADTKIWANVSIYHNVQIGKNCLIQANTVIGSDGFGYANERGEWLKIPQIGSVRIGNNVEIGACTTIDRGALDDTIIGNGVIIDNQCQIAHNVMIGDHTAIAGGVIMAGSLTIGSYCMIGGASVINGHITICDKVHITGMSMVIRSISKPGIYSSGIPLQENKKWRKTAALVLRIDDMQHRLKSVEQQLKDS